MESINIDKKRKARPYAERLLKRRRISGVFEKDRLPPPISMLRDIEGSR